MASSQQGAVFRSIRALLDEGAAGGLNDAQLLGRFVDGRGRTGESAFAALVERHGPMVLGVCRDTLRDLHDAQDAFQATFLILAQKAGTIRRRDSVASWLFGVARKVATRARVDAARRRVRERASAVGAEAPTTDREPDEFAALFEEIDRLPRIYREPVVLCYLEGLTHEAAAQTLRCPVGTVSVRVKRAKDRLRARLTRRDLVGSVGLLAAVVAPGAARAAVPAEFSARTARSALLYLEGKATAAGVVPVAVAHLVERTISVMRQQTIGAGLIRGGAVMMVLAATATVTMFESARTPGVAAPPSAVPVTAAEPARPWVQELPDGVTVELVGVSAHPSAAGTWRNPYGGPLLAPPYAKLGGNVFPAENLQAREFAVRLEHPPGILVSHRWDIRPVSSSCESGFPTDGEGKVVPDVFGFAMGLPRNVKVCTVRFGVASGPWKTEISSDTGGSAIGRAGMSVIFGKAHEVAGQTFVTITHDITPDETRIVAVDPDGKEHAASRTSGSSVRDYTQHEAEFDLHLARVKEFRLQSRPYHWASFEGVVLGD